MKKQSRKPISDVPKGSHFSLSNLPYGVFTPNGSGRPRCGVAVGDYVVDLAEVVRTERFPASPELRDMLDSVFEQGSLNAFMSLGRPTWRATRKALAELLGSEMGDDAVRELLQRYTYLRADVTMHMPAVIGDYTDFYASKEHAQNGAAIMRGARALAANWLHLPVAYHSRSSSIVVSGTPIRRPRGQVLPEGASEPSMQPCAALDFELEMACLIGPGNHLGEAISIDQAEEHIFGYVLMNDWSARDLQRWEMQPLGPFNSKNWATSISPWVVTPEALEPFRCAAPEQDPQVLPYLRQTHRTSYDIKLQVRLTPQDSEQATILSCSNFRHLYWTTEQMIAHHTYGGCNLRTGDLLGTGTISSPEGGGLGSLLEIAWGGSKPVALEDGSVRKWLHDGDTVTLSGFCQGNKYRVGFGECTGLILPAHGQ